MAPASLMVAVIAFSTLFPPPIGGKPETLEHWREEWARICNAKFMEKGYHEKIGLRSFERQGSDQLPTIHEGSNVRQMSARKRKPHFHDGKLPLTKWRNELSAQGNDFAGIKNWFNECYARNTSRKIRAVQKAKGERGVPLTVDVPYRYDKGSNDRRKWLVDEEAAAVVKRIFDMCMGGETRSIMDNHLRLDGAEKLEISRGQLKRNEKRIAERKRLFIKIYEDNIRGKLDDGRYDMMRQNYDAEQKQPEAEVSTLRKEIEVQE